jgi:hypothetical protein
MPRQLPVRYHVNFQSALTIYCWLCHISVDRWLYVDLCTLNLFCPVFRVDSDSEISFVRLCLEYALMWKMLMLNFVEFDLFDLIIILWSCMEWLDEWRD